MASRPAESRVYCQFSRFIGVFWAAEQGPSSLVNPIRHTRSVPDHSGRPAHRCHGLRRKHSRCRARSCNIARCPSAGTASAHLLVFFRSSAGCRWKITGAREQEGADGSSLPPGTAPVLAAQGVYVNTPRRHAGLRRRQAACVQFGHAFLRPSAGRPAGWSAGTRRVKSQAVASRTAESRICVLLHFRST